MPLCTDKSPGYSTTADTLPFNIQFNNNSDTSRSQVVCNTNMCLLPNGPIIPTRPIFPSALPPTFRPSTTNIDTNFLNVKKVGCINNLRTTNLVVSNSGNAGETKVQFINLPQVSGNDAQPLMISADGILSIGRMTPVVNTKQFYNKQKIIPKRFVGNINQKTYDTDDSLNYHEGQY